MVRFPWMVQDRPVVVTPGISLLHLTTGTTDSNPEEDNPYQKLSALYSSALQNKLKKPVPKPHAL